MRAFIYIVCAASLVLSGCGHKGGLKTPTQAAKDIEKKAKKKTAREREAQKQQEAK